MKLPARLSSELPSAEATAVSIRVGTSTYDVLVGSELLGAIGEKASKVLPRAGCAVISDENTAALFADVVIQALSASGFKPTLIRVAAGEKSKSLEQLGTVCDEMAAAGLDRTSFVVALGGGVVGDLAGFAAAIYQRGIPHVQIPTTLLAQVDSSIGGKTAVNTAAGKNLLGAVHQPVLVVADVETLKSLPARELNQGFAEIIKHAVIADPSLFDALEEVIPLSKLHGGEIASWKFAPLVQRNIEIKAAIVARDERDGSGERAILNFGHTVGHAIERAGGYGAFLHGEAISLGIVAACEISVRKAGLPEGDRRKTVAMLQAFGLPTRLPSDFPRERILTALQTDKKFERGEVRFVVTSALGTAHLTSDVTMEEIARAMDIL